MESNVLSLPLQVGLPWKNSCLTSLRTSYKFFSIVHRLG
jgi:hypothetical protein